MSTFVRTFILCPDFDHPPESIKLGHIIATPSTPWITLNGKDRVAPDDLAIFQRTEENWTSVRSESRTASFGAFDVFLRLLGLDSPSTNTSETKITADVVKTTTFEPTRDYIEKCLKLQGVQRFLFASRYRKPVFIITGTMVAIGANFSKSAFSGSEISNASLGASGVPIPVGLDPPSSLVATKKGGISFEKESDFVFAYRLRKITFQKSNFLFRAKSSILSGLDDRERQFEIDKGDGGAEDIKDVVAETIKDAAKSESTSQILLYSAEDYNKGAWL